MAAPSASEAAEVSIQASADPVDVQPPPLPMPSAGKTSIASFAAAKAAAAPASFDAFLAHLKRCTSTRSGADAILMFVGYAANLSGNLLESSSRAALRKSATRLIAMALKLPPSTAVSFSTSAPVASPLAALALQLSVHLKAAASTISEIRTFGRIWSLLDLYFAAKKIILSVLASKSDASTEKNSNSFEKRFDTTVAAAQVLSLIIFQVSESTAYLSSRKVLGFSPPVQGRLALLSVRAWAAYTGIEIGRMLVERRRRILAAGGSLTTSEDLEFHAKWKKAFLKDLAWAPVTVHYSFGSGFLHSIAVAALCLYPATSGVRDVWRANA